MLWYAVVGRICPAFGQRDPAGQTGRQFDILEGAEEDKPIRAHERVHGVRLTCAPNNNCRLNKRPFISSAPKVELIPIDRRIAS